MNIKPNDLVLEIGSGNNPNPRTDILCDRYLWDNEERAGKFPIVIDRPMIVADGYHLPFGDKAFDYVICSHILEHMDNPLAFIKEVMRVGKRGYIEVPSALSERIFGWDFHHWYCTLESNVLVLRKKTSGEQFGGFFHRLIAQTIWFRRFFEANEKDMYVKYEWNGVTRVRVEQHEPGAVWVQRLDVMAWKLLKKGRPQRLEDAFFYMSWMLRRLRKKSAKTYRKFSWNIQNRLKSTEILDRVIHLVRCIGCFKQTLRVSGGSIICDHCDARYPITQHTIPVLLSKKQIAQGY